MATVPTDELLNRVVDGDQDALTELLERHGPTVYQQIGRKIPRKWQSVLTADDVMQQTYADVFLNVGRFVPQGEKAFVGWLATLANRNLVDAIRMLEADKRGGNRQRVEPGTDAETISYVALHELLGGTTTPSRHVARKETKSALEKAIGQLPDAYRCVVTMYDIEGHPLKEVAKILGRTPGAASMLRFRALQRLAQIMGSASGFLSGST